MEELKKAAAQIEKMAKEQTLNSIRKCLGIYLKTTGKEEMSIGLVRRHMQGGDFQWAIALISGSYSESEMIASQQFNASMEPWGKICSAGLKLAESCDNRDAFLDFKGWSSDDMKVFKRLNSESFKSDDFWTEQLSLALSPLALSSFEAKELSIMRGASFKSVKKL